MKKRFILVAMIIASGLTLSAQNHKAPNEAKNPEITRSISATTQALLMKAPTTLWQDNVDESWYNASSTEFTLTTAAQVAGLAKIVNAGNDFVGKTIIIGNDIDFGAHLWMPIGKGYEFPFSGEIKGNNKKISNIFINLPGGDFVGFVGQMFKGSIENLTAENVIIAARDTTGSIVGNLSTNSTMNNCHAKNVNISVTGFNAGGLVGGLLTDSSISNSSAEGEVTGVNQIGGLVGTVWNKTSITKSYAKGTVYGDYIIGGFAGYSTMAMGPERDNVITDSYTRSNVFASAERVGGFYGGPQFSAITNNVYSTGTVSEIAASGGFAGFVGMMSAENIYYDKTNADMDAIGLLEGPPMEYDIEGLASANMKNQNFADLLNNGRSTAVWYFDASKNDGYAILDFERTLSTVNNSAASKIAVYPTVVTDMLFITSKEKNVSYKIVDFSGRMLQSGIVNDGKVNLSQLQKGNYMILLQSGGNVSNHKLIKK